MKSGVSDDDSKRSRGKKAGSNGAVGSTRSTDEPKTIGREERAKLQLERVSGKRY